MFTPLTVRSLTVANRFVMAPMTRMASPNGVPGPDVAAYYRRRAEGGVGLIITEGIRLPHPSAGWPTTISSIAGADALAGWQRVTDAVHTQGGAIAAQLWHQGSERLGGDDSGALSPSGLDTNGQPKGRALGTDELVVAAQWYADAARNARSVGFDAVEIHGAHGYLLDEFLWEKTNHRVDGYGGSPTARARFPAEVVAAVRAAVGPDYPIIFRFSQWKTGHYDARIAETPDQLSAVLSPLVEAGVDVLHASTRRHYVPGFAQSGSMLSLAGWAKKLKGVPVIAVGSVGLQTENGSDTAGSMVLPGSIETMARQFRDGEFDLIAIGRALLADPTWVNRLRDGTLHEFAGYHPDVALGDLR
ncbi:12-oxophytodienoate reductase [Mycobacterium kubicae]|uniref:12-oxophytodienoate reductase n=1 Tax=Mycobacterium kubicae TaxID=120959 RepID=A0AAX1JIV5_9MYCO|nr:12-oxophytodienoate reductase [Mycobacterium kubicae]QNI14513.1 12-oxophytodienoate reductase [Mycobacterium kubicae]QPI40439.1 12-oxophytodienoate reductase [Mycobacterium kubicae]